MTPVVLPALAQDPAPASSTLRAAGIALALAFAGVLFAAVARVPFLSEDYTVLAASAAMTVRDCFDITRPPLRPLHDLFFLALERSGLAPWQARLPGFALYLFTAALVWRLAALVGCSPPRRLAAMALFLAFPAAVSVTWVAAVSTLGKTTFMLLALCALLAQLRQPSAARGACAVAAFVIALGWHQASVALTGVLAAVVLGAPAVRRRAARDPWMWAVALLGVGYVVLLVCLSPEQRHHGIKQVGAVLANVPRAMLAFAPEPARLLAIAGLRGMHGIAGFVAAGLLLGVVCLVGLWAWRRAHGVLRGLLVGVVFDLMLPVLVTGFVVRYAGFGSALVAVVLVACARTRLATIAVAALGLSWALAHVREVRDVRAAGAVVDAIVTATEKARASLGAEPTLHIVDPPGLIGPERDVPVFNWGLTAALRRAGLGERYRVVRTVDYVTSSDVEKVPAAVAASLAPRVDWASALPR
jgi:hypothetical protein